MLVRVLVAVSPPSDPRRLRDLIGGAGRLVSSVDPGAPLWESAGIDLFDLIVTDPSGLSEPVPETLRAIRDLPASPDVIVAMRHETGEDRARLLGAGCRAVIDLATDDASLRGSLDAIVERRREDSRLRLAPPAAGERLGDFVSSSLSMRQLLGVARRVAASDTTLLLLGETGTGKEWLARGIHADGPRSQGAFLAVNCGAIPEGLLESELFGHKKGAFTGATSDRRGHFELAHGGTLFLDEIGEMSLQVQVKLLRVLQERKIQPVGGERPIEVDVRVMAATNRDPQQEMEAGRLRRDLYYRIGVVTLSVPPLRERREDIRELVENYFEIYRLRLGRTVYGIDGKAMRALLEYDWPGNVRELINVMERAVLLASGEDITLGDLPQAIAMNGSTTASPPGLVRTVAPLSPVWLAKPLREARREAAAEFERAYLTALLIETRGRIGETARRAGVSPRALFERMKQLGLRKEDFRTAPSLPGATGRPR